MDTLLWLLFTFMLLQPVIAHGMLGAARTRLLLALAAKRSSRVIALVHRQEKVSLLGVPVFHYIDMEDSQTVIRAVSQCPPDTAIDIILHSPGSQITAAEQISAALCRHKGKVAVFVPHYAMSGSALIALAADELVMNEDAVLGAVEPMVGQFPAASIERVLAQKKLASVEDKTWVLADDARKERDQLKAKLKTALTRRGRMTDDDGERIASLLTSGRCTPDYPISVEELKEIGLVISTEIPLEIYQFMNLFPQIKTNRPSVDFVPTPHH